MEPQLSATVNLHCASFLILSDMKIAIVGGGIIGLNAGLQLREQFRDAQITIFASSFEHTTSHIAAGIFRIGTSYMGPNEEITK